jgi:tRNA(fMet)-specific endonuclease VapC
MPPAQTYLLDTNILVLLVRGKDAGHALDQQFGLRFGINRCMISIVTVGEMKALSRKFGWGTPKIEAMNRLLDQFFRVGIDHPAILDAFAEIDAESDRSGRKMSKNDVWIAATAKITGATY